MLLPKRQTYQNPLMGDLYPIPDAPDTLLSTKASDKAEEESALDFNAIVRRILDGEPLFEPTDTGNLLQDNAENVLRMAGNVPSSAVNLLRSLGQFGKMAAFGPGDELQRQLFNTADTEEAQKLRALGSAVTSREGLGQLGQAFMQSLSPSQVVRDPLGGFANAAAVLSGGAAAMGQLPGKAAPLLQNIGKAAGAADPAVAIPNVLGKGAGKAVDMAARATEGPVGGLVPELFGVSTGIQGGPLRRLRQAGFEGGDAAKQAKMYISEQKKGDVLASETIQELQQVKRQLQADYDQGLREIDAQNIVLDISDIKKDVADAMQRYEATPLRAEIEGVRIGTVSPAQRTEVLNAVEAITQAPDKIDAISLDTIKRQLDDFTTESTEGGALVGKLRDRVRDKLDIERYNEITSNYEEFMKDVKTIQQGVGVNISKPNLKTARTGLESALRENRDVEYEAAQLIEKYTKTPVTARIAGFNASQAMPKELGGRTLVAGSLITNPSLYAAGFDWALPLLGLQLTGASPKIVGRAMMSLGANQRRISDANKLISDLKKALDARGISQEGLSVGAALERLQNN